MSTGSPAGDTGRADEAPPVVAVIVTCNAGPWLEEALAAFGAQDYPNLSVLVVDAASIDDPLERIAAALPTAFVRRLSYNPGFSAAANRALRVVQGASHLLLCHDDVAPAPDAVSKMMEASIRQQAGLVMPKMVDWHDPHVLRSLGGSADRTGAFISAVESGDFDQGQHDTPSDVFVASGGCTLIRTDLFAALNGYDSAITLFGEDVDLSWRAQLASARIVSAPSARVRHLEAAGNGMRLVTSTAGEGAEAHPTIDEIKLRRRHRLRTALKTPSAARLPGALLYLALLSVIESGYALATGRTKRVAAIASAWAWNILHWRDLVKSRRRLHAVTTAEPAVVQHRLGSAHHRLESVVRREWEAKRQQLQDEGWTGRDVVGAVRNLSFAVGAAIALLWLLGSRNLIGSAELPAVGQFASLDGSPLEALRNYFGLNPPGGFGVASPVVPSELMLGLLGFLFVGAMGVAQKVLILATLPLALWGVVRMVRPLESTRARLAAVAAYAAAPVPYVALSQGRLDVLVAYAAAPWILSRLLQTLGAPPYLPVRSRQAMSLRIRPRRRFDDDELEKLVVSDIESGEGDPKRLQAAAALLGGRRFADEAEAPAPTRSKPPVRDRITHLLMRRIVPLALLLSTAGAFAPQLLAVVVAAAVLLAAGSVLAGSAGAGRLRTVATAIGASLVAAVILLPGLQGAASGFSAIAGEGVGTNQNASLASFLTLAPAESVQSWWMLGLLIAALPGVLFGTEWRFRLSVQLWVVTVGLVLLAWAGSHGWTGPVDLDPLVCLSVAAVALALNTGTGVLALAGVTLPQATERNWKRVVPALAVAALLAAYVPLVQRASDGAWDLPKFSDTQLLGWMDAQESQGSFRTLWLGDQDVVPGARMTVSDDLSASIATDGSTPVGGLVAPDGGEGESAVLDAVRTARVGDTVALGRALGVFGVKYVVVPSSTGSIDGSSVQAPPPADLTGSLSSQLDLVSVGSTPALTVYENRSWVPVRAALSPEAILASRQDAIGSRISVAQGANLAGLIPVLPRDGAASWEGPVPPGEVFVGEARNDSWSLKVDGREMPRRSAFEWAMTYPVGAGGEAQLSYRPPLFVPVLQVAVIAAWALLALIALRFRERRGRRA